MVGYVVKFDNCSYYDGFAGLKPDLFGAKIYKNKNRINIENICYKIGRTNCKIVPVNIEEIT